MNCFGNFYKNYLHTAIVCALIIGVVVGVVLYFDRQHYNRIENDTSLHEKIFYYVNDTHKPVLNPKPQYYLKIVVTGDADLLKRLQLYFVMQYGARAFDCIERTGTFSTGTFNPYINVMQWAGKKRQPPYVFVFPLDRYERGTCDWRGSGLRSGNASYNNWPGSPDKKATSTFSFKYENDMPFPSQAGGIMICNKELTCHTAKGFVHFGFGIPLQNYTYFLHFIKQQEN